VRGYLAAIVTGMMAAGAVAACAATPPLNNYSPIRKDTKFPTLGTEIEVRRGEDMVRHGKVTETLGLRLYRGAVVGGLPVSAGFYPRIGADRKYTFHSFRQAPTSQDLGHIPPTRGALGNWSAPPSAIRVARDGTELCLIFARKGSKRCTRNVGKHRRVKRFILSDRDLLQKLTYLGTSGGTIRLRYWENSGHFARPESTRELRFPAKTPLVVDHKGARITILRADANSVRFVVQKNFPPYWAPPRIEPQL